jgi:hypothetical protein
MKSVRPHLYALPAAVLVMVVFLWMVTCGSGDLLAKEAFGSFYDAQARSLLSGRWDVPRSAILDEAFLRDGKAYGYFGFAPALLHLPLVLLWSRSDGCQSRMSELAACGVSLWFGYQLLLRARTAFGLAPGLDRLSKVLYSLFLVNLGLGSSLIFLASEAYVFHEAIIWGSAFSLAGFNYLARYFTTGRLRCLIGAGAWSFLAFFSRGSVGTGALTALTMTTVAIAVSRGAVLSPGPGSDRGYPRPGASSFWRRCFPGWRTPGPSVPLWHAAIPAGVAALTLMAFVAINYAKFRTCFDAAPLRLYSQMQSNPRRLNRVAGKQVSLANVRSGARAYFSPAAIEWRATFPWVFATRSAQVYPEARYDLIEPYASLPASAPAACCLALAGFIAAGWLWRCRSIAWPGVLIIGASAGAAAPLAADALTFRYLHDMFPLLVVCGALGLNALLLLPKMARHAALAALLPALIFSIWANSAITIVYQRVTVNGTPGDCRREFKTWQQYIDRHVRFDG